MKVYEVNFTTISDWTPFDESNMSEYVKAETAQEAIQIVKQLSKYYVKNICFCCEIKTLN